MTTEKNILEEKFYGFPVRDWQIEGLCMMVSSKTHTRIKHKKTWNGTFDATGIVTGVGVEIQMQHEPGQEAFVEHFETEDEARKYLVGLFFDDFVYQPTYREF